MLTQYASSSKQMLDIPWLSWEEFKTALIPYQAGSKTLAQTILDIGTTTSDGSIVWVTLNNQVDFALIEFKASLRRGTTKNSSGSIRCFESEEVAKPCLSGRVDHEGRLTWNSCTLEPSWQTLKELMSRSQELAIKPIENNLNLEQEEQASTKTVMESAALDVKLKDGIRWVHCEELKGMTRQWAQKTTFDERFKALKQNMTYEDGRYKLWLSFNQDYSHALQLQLKPEPTFDSNTFSQSTRYPNIQGLKKPHWGLYLEEFSNKKEIPSYLNWEIASNGQCSELYFISCGQYARGNQVMDLFKHLQGCLRTDVVYIQDDARNTDDQRLRLLRPLTHSDGKTWYQSHGFELLNCTNVLDEKGKHLYNQSSEKHSQAIQTIRHVSLESLDKNLKKPDSIRVHQCAKKYLPGYQFKDISLSQISTEIFHQSCQSSRSSRKAKLDLTFLYDKFLRPENFPESPKNPVTKEFQEAVKEVFDSRLFALKKPPSIT